MRGEVSVAYDYSRNQVTLQLPPTHLSTQLKGQIHFYRPSNAKLDFDLPLDLNPAGAQRVSTGKLQAGLWKVRVSWTSGGQEYFHDQSLVL